MADIQRAVDDAIGSVCWSPWSVLAARGRVHEIPGQLARLQAMADAYLEAPTSTVTDARRDRIGRMGTHGRTRRSS